MTAPRDELRPAVGFVDAQVRARARELLPVVRAELGLEPGERRDDVYAVALERARREAGGR